MASLIPISDVRANLPNLVAKVSKTEERVLITVNGKPKAVMVSIDELEALEETAEILAIPGARESIKRGKRDIKMGRVIPFEEVVGKTASEVLKDKKRA